MVKKVYLVENLDCANCASKVEAALNALPEVQEAVLTYATMQLRITAEDPDALLPKLQEAAQKVEPEVELSHAFFQSRQFALNMKYAAPANLPTKKFPLHSKKCGFLRFLKEWILAQN